MGIAEIAILIAMLGIPALVIALLVKRVSRRQADVAHQCPTCGTFVADCEGGCSNCGCDVTAAGPAQAEPTASSTTRRTSSGIS